jgi:hypothetical protein
MEWNDGGIYEGYFENDMKNGLGKCSSFDGNIYEGDFINGSPNGYGKECYNNGDIYEGGFKNGLRHGKWLMYNEKGLVIFEISYKNGKKVSASQHSYASNN